MKKISTPAVKQTNSFREQRLTIGLDLGDRSSWSHWILMLMCWAPCARRSSTTTPRNPRALPKAEFIVEGSSRARGFRSPSIPLVRSGDGHNLEPSPGSFRAMEEFRCQHNSSAGVLIGWRDTRSRHGQAN